MDSLPAELLSIIFVNALPPFASDFPHDSDPASIHVRICSVCRKWNSVALSTPEFWSQITISSKLSSHNDMKRRLRLSQQSKLGVHIQLSMMSLVGGPTESFKEVHSLLVQAVGRWKSLSIKGGIFSLKDLVDYVPSILPCVEDITFDVYELDRAAAGENLLISAPRVSRCVSNTQVRLALALFHFIIFILLAGQVIPSRVQRAARIFDSRVWLPTESHLTVEPASVRPPHQLRSSEDTGNWRQQLELYRVVGGNIHRLATFTPFANPTLHESYSQSHQHVS